MLRIDRITDGAVRVLRSDGTPLLTRCHVADGRLSRAVGLLFTSRLDSGEGVLIDPCASVHTFGMRAPISVAFLDRDRVVLSVHPEVRPWRLARHRGAAVAVEAAADVLAPVGVGERLQFAPPEG